MSAKYRFQFQSDDKHRPLPHKLILAQRETETPAHVLLKLFGYLLFYREHLQIEPRVDRDDLPFEPDLLELDYTLRPVLWVECGDCSVEKLDRLAVKVPAAALWVLKRSVPEAEHLMHLMARHELRRNRYRIVGLDAAMFTEVSGLLTLRTDVYWLRGGFDPPNMQFEFNGLWFDTDFRVWTF